VDAVPRQALLVELHQRRLTDCGARLQVREVGRSAGEPEATDPGADRAGGDEHDFPPAGPRPVELVGERVDAVPVEPPGRVGEHVRADLHDDRSRSPRLPPPEPDRSSQSPRTCRSSVW
jgi:hypothetical protein